MIDLKFSIYYLNPKIHSIVMIYLDANIFIYAYFKPKKGKILSEKIQWCKNEAKEIIKKINEEVNKYCISIIQLSEIVNLLKSVMSWEDLQKFIMGLISNKSIEIVEIPKLMYINAVNRISDYNMDSNAISALLIMKEMKIKQIYTFDHHYEHFEDIIRLPKIPQKFEKNIKK
ncbi:MAG: type II toxin-antitoxin system VapC family toxin [Candidatus Lokiarchaeota archaeon]|nr:type II toxin-antitoxin system VapC family toxin [Candidatus Lokiarchaeota archaeon]